MSGDVPGATGTTGATGVAGVAGVTAAPAPTSEDRWARAAWSRLVEPGERVGHAVLDQLGGPAALRLVRTGDLDGVRWWPTEQLARVREAVTGWQARLAGLDVERDLETLERLGGRVLVPGDEEWPAGLADLGAAGPACLWVRGPAHLAEAAHGSVALVGARAATPYGERVAGDLAGACAQRGSAVVSGGAYGIDGAAHRGALAAAGATIAVLAGGVDRFYPAGNQQLLAAIARDGAVVSEAPPGCAPTRWRFLARNRLIAATAHATVVVEAAWRSGALSTAARAADLGRPVGAVPGPVTSMASAGCHRLVREARAVLVTDPAEVFELLDTIGTPQQPTLAEALAPVAVHDGLTPEQVRVYDALPVRAAMDVDRLVPQAGLPVAAVMAALGSLSLRGLVERSGGERWRRRAP